MIEFQTWPKTPRLLRDIVITEKIDGTNSAIIIEQLESFNDADPDALAVLMNEGLYYQFGAQSRNRLIFPGKTTDNYGFADWVQHNAEKLFDILGPGRHFGEWWGHGIARKYDMDHRKFSLFNTSKGVMTRQLGEHKIGTVPVIYSGPFDMVEICDALDDLKTFGSLAKVGFPDPEGICVFHTQSRQVYKITLDNNDAGKWEYGTTV